MSGIVDENPDFVKQEFTRMSDSLSGQEINGYIIGPLIGQGGMGEVYQAYPPNSTEAVAIKILRVDDPNIDVNFQDRFVREIRLLESLQHENIVPIYDYGTTPTLIYFTMRLIGGITLTRLMERHSFTPRSAWKILRPLASALIHAHEQGIVHRDIKPGNVFLERLKDENWRVYLGDFGLGKRPGSDEELTMAGASVGTTEYMSPEAVLGAPLDHISDVYSLVVVIYEMLLGRLPIRSRNPNKVLATEILMPPIAPSDLNRDFPPILENVLLIGLANDKFDRYQTVQDFAEEYYQALQKMSDEELNATYQVNQPG